MNTTELTAAVADLIRRSSEGDLDDGTLCYYFNLQR